MQSLQSKINELKTGREQWRVVVAFACAFLMATFVLEIYFFAVSKIGWGNSIFLGVVLLLALTALPKLSVIIIQNTSDMMFFPPPTILSGDPIYFAIPLPLLCEISNIFKPPVTPPRRVLA